MKKIISFTEKNRARIYRNREVLNACDPIHTLDAPNVIAQESSCHLEEACDILDKIAEEFPHLRISFS